MAAPAAPNRLGVRSIVLSLLALGLLAAAGIVLVNLPTDAPERTSDTVSIVFLIAFALSPLLHIAGIASAIAGLVRGGAVPSCLTGLVLNLLLLGAGSGAAYYMAQGIGAFT